jgi:hypothetical protein
VYLEKKVFIDIIGNKGVNEKKQEKWLRTVSLFRSAILNLG